MSFQPSSTKSLLLLRGSEYSRRQKLPQIPGYEIECEIGRGGMATVYRAVQQALGRQVALKVLRQEAGVDDDFVQRFEKEGRFLAQMLHSNIITIYDIGLTEENQLFLSIEYLAGGTLKSRIKQGLPLDSAVEIIKTIAKALAYTHERGVIHRDIKPSNIIFRQNGVPVLTDFGVARLVDSKTIYTMTGLSIGSPGYMSPEQVRGETATIQSDLYSLGATFYEMLVGFPLYNAENPLTVMLKHLNDPIPELPGKCAHFQPILSKVLAKNTEDRYKNIGEFLNALDFFSSENTELIPKPSVKIPDKKLVNLASGKIRNLVKKKPRFYAWFIGGFFISITIFHLLNAYGFIGEKTNVPQAELSVDRVSPNDDMKNIEKLLELAESQLQTEHLANHSNMRNAEATYREILKLDHSNIQALEGLQNIATAYENQAQKNLDIGQLEKSLDLVYQGLAVVPGHQGLMQLRDTVRQDITKEKDRQAKQEEQRQRRLQVEQLLLQAQDRLQQGSLEISLVYIEQGLLVIPDDRQLLALRDQVLAQKINLQNQAKQRQRQEQEARWKAELVRRGQVADGYLASALESESLGQYLLSWPHAEQGQAATSNHLRLMSLREEVPGQFALEQQQAAEQARREQDIKNLLEKAEMQLAARRLTQPAGDNAEETYRQLLELDPPSAQTGFVRIADEYEQFARQQREAGALPESLALIDQGLTIAPTHEGLLTLHQEVNAEWEAELKQLEQKRREQERLNLEQSRKKQQKKGQRQPVQKQQKPSKDKKLQPVQPPVEPPHPEQPPEKPPEPKTKTVRPRVIGTF